jgi:transcriptional regulator with XRE-family HTH domain
MTSTLAQRVLIERRTLNWNQDQLAAKAGVSRSYVSHIERSQIPNPTVDVVEALAAALGVSPAYLLGWSDDPIDGDITAQPLDPRLAQLLDLFDDLDPAGQAAALEIIHTLRRTQHARVVGT